ncbi:unnamed protein product [Musa acuminata subsp. burmannicoides]
MEPRDGDLQDAYFPHPFDDAVVQRTPPPPVSPDDEEADQGDAQVAGAYEMDDSQLVSSPFALSPAFEPSQEDAAGEEALPMSEAAAAAVAAVEASGPVKRKRGRPPKAHGAGRAPVPKKKKEEEEVCFICFDGGDLVLCDRRGCPKVYHPACINRDEAFFRSRARWNCGWHICSTCQKAATYMCFTCTYSLCKACIREARFFCVRGNKGFCEACYRTIMLIESNGQDNEEKVRVDFDDKSSWEYLFKVYWLTLKGKLSVTIEDLHNAKNPWKGCDTSMYNEETSDELYNANDDQEASSDSTPGHHEGSISSRKKVRKRSKKSAETEVPAQDVDSEKKSLSEDSKWASPVLLEFVAHMKNGDKSVLSQFDVQALLLDYIKRNNLRDPRRKSQIICDARLQNMFGKLRVGHFEMLKLLESHFLIKEAPQIGMDDNQGGTIDSDSGQIDAEEHNMTSIGSDKRLKTRKRVGERELQANLDEYAAIDAHNINLIYLRRNLMEDLINDDNFSKNVVGSFVRIRISGAGQKQDMYRLVQIIGTHVLAEKYKLGKKTTDIALEILNLNKTEILSIDSISNQDFTEEECKRLRQSIKCGLINRLTVGDLLEKAQVLQEVRVKDWLENEKLRLSHLRDRASETGRRKELRECIEKLQILNKPEEYQRRIREVPEIHVDTHMDPNYESPEEEADNKKEDNFNRSRGSLSRRKGKELISPGRRGSISNYHLNDATKSLSTSWTSGTQTGGAEEKIETIVALGDRKCEISRTESNIGWTDSSGTLMNGNKLVTGVEHPCGVAPDTMISSPGVPLPSNVSESDKVWQYQDPSGKIQGPFSMSQLRKWSSTGYFPPDLRIWLKSQKQEDSMLLADVLPEFLKDTQQKEPQPTNFIQPTNFVAEANTGHNWDIVSRGDTNPTSAGIKQNNHWSANQNDITMSIAGYKMSNVDRWAPQAPNYIDPRRELMMTEERKIGISPRAWESTKDTNAWYGQHTSHNNPSTKISVPFAGNPYDTPAYQVTGGQASNAEGRNRNQEHGSSWSSFRSKPTRPSDQGYDERHSNWSSSGQHSHQVSAQYQQIQPVSFSKRQWVNDAHNPPTPTPQPSGMVWTRDRDHLSASSAAAAISVQSAGCGWEATPSAEFSEFDQLAAESMEGKGSVPEMTSAGGWAKTSCNLLNQSAAPEVWGSGSTASLATSGANQNFGKVDNLDEPSWASKQEKPFESNATTLSGSFMKKSHFFESSCPSPTPSSERDDIPLSQISEPDPDDKWNEASGTPDAESEAIAPDTTVLASMPLDLSVLSSQVVRSMDEVADQSTEIENLSPFSSATEDYQPSLAGTSDNLVNLPLSAIPAAKPDAVESVSVQEPDSMVGSQVVSELKEAKYDLDGLHASVSSSGSGLDQNQAKNLECFSGSKCVLEDTKLPSPTPASEPSGRVLAIDSTSGKSQSDTLGSSDVFVSPLSPIRSDPSMGPAAFGNPASSMAEGASDKGWTQGSANIIWGISGQRQTSTETGWMMPKQKRTSANTSWVTPAQGNREENLGWVTQGNMNPNAGWGVPTASSPGSNLEESIKANSEAETGWGVPGAGNLNWSPQKQQGNDDTGWGTALGSNNACWSSSAGYHDVLISQKRHGGDRYQGGREPGHGGGNNPRNKTYIGGDGGGGWSQPPPRGQWQGLGRGHVQRGVCKFHESGHCKKGASCKYLHR